MIKVLVSIGIICMFFNPPRVSSEAAAKLPVFMLEKSCLVMDEIETIGGCDSEGVCSYFTKYDEYEGKKAYPIKGQIVCVKEKVNNQMKRYFGLL